MPVMTTLTYTLLAVGSSSALSASAVSPQLRGVATRAAVQPLARFAAVRMQENEFPTLEEEVRCATATLPLLLLLACRKRRKKN